MKLSTMNRVLAAVLALGMTAALAGCGSTASSEATAESAATEETAASSATEETAEVDESAYDYLADFSFSQAYDDNGYLKDVTAGCGPWVGQRLLLPVACQPRCRGEASRCSGRP